MTNTEHAQHARRKAPVPEGYKQTEVGVIPEEWIVAPLSQAVEQLEAGVSVNSIDEDIGSYAQEKAILKTSAIVGGQFFPHECKKIAPRDIGRAKLNPRFDTIIVSRMNTPDLVGECGYVFDDFPNLFLPDRLWMTRIHRDSNVCVRWLSYLLSSKPYKTRLKGLATGTSGSMKNIAKDALFTIPIAYPRETEQRAIADALSDVDALLDGLDRLIAKKRDLKQAAMQQLLTGQTRLPGFAEEWEVKRLGDIATCFSGGTPATHVQSYYNGDIPWITSSDLNKGFIVDIDGRITQEGLKNSAAKMVEPNTLLIALYGATSGVTAISKIFAAINQAVLAIVTNKDDTMFLFYKLKSLKDWLISTFTQGGQPNLSGEIVKSIELSIPSLSEQTAIAAVLSDMDAEIAAIEQRRHKTRNLKQAIMQELLTGKTRLVTPGGSHA